MNVEIIKCLFPAYNWKIPRNNEQQITIFLKRNDRYYRSFYQAIELSTLNILGYGQ